MVEFGSIASGAIGSERPSAGKNYNRLPANLDPFWQKFKVHKEKNSWKEVFSLDCWRVWFYAQRCLDLRGGVHFLMEVDVDAALKQAEERYISDFRTLLRENRVRYTKIDRASKGEQSLGVDIRFKSEEVLE